MVEKFGALADFDFLYQKTSEEGARVPRGFAFVTYQTQVCWGGLVMYILYGYFCGGLSTQNLGGKIFSETSPGILFSRL